MFRMAVGPRWIKSRHDLSPALERRRREDHYSLIAEQGWSTFVNHVIGQCGAPIALLVFGLGYVVGLVPANFQKTFGNAQARCMGITQAAG
jgi:hypothetical protein